MPHQLGRKVNPPPIGYEPTTAYVLHGHPTKKGEGAAGEADIAAVNRDQAQHKQASDPHRVATTQDKTGRVYKNEREIVGTLEKDWEAQQSGEKRGKESATEGAACAKSSSSSEDAPPSSK